jgi:hypothetical protein
MGPRSAVYAKSAICLLRNVTGVEAGVNDSFEVELVAGDTDTMTSCTVAAGEYDSASALAAAIQTAFNESVPFIYLPDSTGEEVTTFATLLCTFNAPNFVLTLVGPQSMNAFGDDSVLTAGVEWVPGEEGTQITRTAPGPDWSEHVLVENNSVRGSTNLEMQVDPAAGAGWQAMVAYVVGTPANISPENTAYAIVAELGQLPRLYVGGVEVAAPNGVLGGVVAAGELFSLNHSEGFVGFERRADVNSGDTEMHEVVGVVSGLTDVIALYSQGTTVTNLARVPGLQPVGSNDFNESTIKSLRFGELGTSVGFVPQKIYTNPVAAPTATFTSDTPILLQNEYPSVKILCRSLPLQVWDGTTGRNLPILASIPKTALVQQQEGQQLLYVDPAPEPIACRFADEQAVSDLVFELQDTDGNRVETTGRTEIVLVVKDA